MVFLVLDFKLLVCNRRKEGEFLQQEANQTRTESVSSNISKNWFYERFFQHEYMSFMSKKTQKKQSAIITLSDKNEHELQKIANEKKEMLKRYEERKEGVLGSSSFSWIYL